MGTRLERESAGITTTATTAPGRYHGSFLLAHFREFYREVARLKAMVGTVPPVLARQATVGGGAEKPTSLEPAAGSLVNGVWQQLLSLLERQSLEASQRGGAFAFEIYREAQYVMVALADEIFLNLDWAGRVQWPLLETRLFESHVAGEAIFQRLERLLLRRDPFYVDLAAVYFMALSLGFQGRFRGREDAQQQLNVYRQQLFAVIYRRQPKLFNSTVPLFVQAHQHTLDKMVAKKLPAPRTWLLLILGVIVVWMGVSSWAWNSLNSGIACQICRILNRSCACSTEVRP